MQSRKFRVQRDSLKAINISMALFLKLVTKTCEVVQSTSASTSLAGGKRAANLLDMEHLSKAVNRYDVLSFMKDLVAELDVAPVPVPIELEDDSGKRVRDDEPMEPTKRHKEDESQPSISSFFIKSN